MNLWNKIWWKVSIDILERKIKFFNIWSYELRVSRLSDWDLIHLQHNSYRQKIIDKHFNKTK